MAKSAKAGAAKAAGTIKIKQIGSVIGCTDRQRANVRGLGLRRMHQVVERKDTPAIRGMVNAVPHLVAIVTD
jgi:large subunit ribosomal protein L30